MTARKSRNGTPDPFEDANALEAMDALEQFAALGPGVQVQVSRMPGAKYLELQPLEGLDCDLMRERYGGGSFSLRARQDGKWMKGVPIRHVEIEGPPKAFPPPIESGGSAATAEIARLNSEIHKLTETPAAAPVGSDAMMVAMMTSLTGIVTTILQSSIERRPESNALEIVELARKLGKDLRRENESSSDPVTSFGLPLLHEIRELRKLESGKPKEPAQLNPPPRPKVPETMQELAEFVARWCAPHARAGANPALRAEVFLEDLYLQNPALAESVIELSRLPGVLDHWAGMVPAVASNRSWHGEFISEVRELAAGAEGDAEPTDDVDQEEHDDPAPEHSEGRRRDASDGPGDGQAGEAGATG